MRISPLTIIPMPAMIGKKQRRFNMNLFIVIITVIYTILYGFLCNYFWTNIQLCQDCFIFLVINSFAAVMINTVFFIAAKYEAYELISGYDKNKSYDNKILKNHLKKLGFRISVCILTCSLIALFAPLLSRYNIDKTLAVIYANLTFVCVFLTILLTAKRLKY